MEQFYVGNNVQVISFEKCFSVLCRIKRSPLERSVDFFPKKNIHCHSWIDISRIREFIAYVYKNGMRLKYNGIGIGLFKTSGAMIPIISIDTSEQQPLILYSSLEELKAFIDFDVPYVSFMAELDWYEMEQQHCYLIFADMVAQRAAHLVYRINLPENSLVSKDRKMRTFFQKIIKNNTYLPIALVMLITDFSYDFLESYFVDTKNEF